MYKQVTIGSAKAYIFDTKDLNECEIVLSSSSKTAKLSTLVYDDIDTKKYREVARVNASLFQARTDHPTEAYGTHQGWEYSDMYKTSCTADTRADVMQFKDGTYKYGDISSSDVDLDNIKWAYSGSHICLLNGEDTTITARWRTDYPKGNYCWSWFATRDDGTVVIGAIDSNYTCDTPSIRDYLKSLGCTNVMINDGGGSAELIVGGNVVNRPKSSERAIANGLFIYEKIESNDTELKALRTENENLKNALKQINDILDKVCL